MTKVDFGKDSVAISEPGVLFWYQSVWPCIASALSIGLVSLTTSQVAIICQGLVIEIQAFRLGKFAIRGHRSNCPSRNWVSGTPGGLAIHCNLIPCRRADALTISKATPPGCPPEVALGRGEE